jgi:hypothetical protein
MDLKFVLGTVNYADYLRVSLAKVSDPGTETYITYINTPVTNYTLVIPNIDPVNYYINFRDAPDNVSLGTLVSQAFVNGQTGEWLYERRFYTIGSLPVGASIDAGYTTLTDTYLVNRNVSGVFKEGFRYLEITTEYTFDPTNGIIPLVGGNFSDGEKFIVEIKYNTGVNNQTVSALFGDTIQITSSTYSVLGTDKGKRFKLDSESVTQEVTLPALSSITTGDPFYFEHKGVGIQAQTRIKTNGSDKILYNGFNLDPNELSELWVSKGESLYLRKEDPYWEVIFDYAGKNVGHRMAATFAGHVNYVPEDGRLMDGDEHPALWWWISNILPSSHKITDDTVVTGGYTHPADKLGLFVVHSTLKKFRMPNTQGLSEKGLADFDSYGGDAANRPYDYPGGYQADDVKSHGHRIKVGGSNSPDPVVALRKSNLSDGYSNGTGGGGNLIEATGAAENRVKNFGVIYLRRI